MIGYETFEHGADVGIRGFGKTLEEAFENGAKAMFSLIVDLREVEAKDSVELSCSAFDTETLFVEWLNSLLTQAHLNKMVFSKFKVKIKDDDLAGLAFGEKLNKEKHRPAIEVKAATYSNLRVAKIGDKYLAQCIVDV